MQRVRTPLWFSLQFWNGNQWLKILLSNAFKKFSEQADFSDLVKRYKLMSVAFPQSPGAAFSVCKGYGHLCGIPGSSGTGTNG